MDVDNSVQRTFSQKLAKEKLKRWIPIQNVVLMTVNCVQNNIVVGILKFPPIRTKNVLGTVDHVSNAVGFCKFGCQHLSGTYQDPCAKPSRRLLHVYIHCIQCRLEFTWWNAIGCNTTPTQLHSLLGTTPANRTIGRPSANVIAKVGIPSTCLGNQLHDPHC